MLKTPLPVSPRKPRVAVWLALAFILGLVGWWEFAAPRASGAAPPQPAALALPAGSEVAVLAGGCFWCTEADFDKLPGVLSTTSGYTGGKTANPTYAEVASHATGHAEAVRVVFDPTRVSYVQLLAHYWKTIDPTARDRQFCDIGTPYRTAIFATTPEQLQLAQASVAALVQTKPFAEPVVTQILMLDDFYPAEEEHQNYHQKNPVRYSYYRTSCGRDARLEQLWGAPAAAR
ncbi:MAG: peptide-methionine (S)-S-oxide reductase MsrA [Gammaproteobacteria bacterium]|uniref:peptide-methionine (S)-S-oxide reductase MsrA n=1 Tax=Rhodoferax sp. TaxID=50421 RepID=UPI0017AEB109|nr:peptide-methionine (S)-S-oxide reductase MsrA [Rhodoferax sp.]MBU3900644.1 peptide-methionine (S)-S-oxide reductase MsrA [Gammaproteobacteria bacterium]MBA3057724.1 peptide-methionine (S)-S-oxide reductase MsrA [Rhodoferax sp.]MBU3996658.1 peptide-methionine (S)-S-oxide reductase MsrA [Gammaproteobacteria bacterium]MBU4080979.1 peptide-methionine (S)-S-oxide reductase MsrA [Gammaproteobacteria bacterium]MBU4112038.1 peptide-methionine (S)-S-oxide reductase MsrA [Gammaproteobacteria bacteriu